MAKSRTSVPPRRPAGDPLTERLHSALREIGAEPEEEEDEWHRDERDLYKCGPKVLPEDEPGMGSRKEEQLIPKRDAVEAIKRCFDTLGIPNLGPVPQKPKFKVQFDLGPAGKTVAWYHWIDEHAGCLSLVYDTRFEYGVQYEPPNLGPETPFIVNIDGKSYSVLSLDFTHPFGIFQIVNLAIVGAQNDRGQPPVSPALMPTTEFLDGMQQDIEYSEKLYMEQ